MELTQYQAAFLILIIFFAGDLVGALTKAKISSMFVLMMGFLVLFLSAHAWMILNTQPAGKRLAKTEAEKNG